MSDGKAMKVSDDVVRRVESLKEKYPDKTQKELLDMLVKRADGNFIDSMRRINQSILRELIFLVSGEDTAEDIIDALHIGQVLKKVVVRPDSKEEREERIEDLREHMIEFIEKYKNTPNQD